MLCCAQCRPPDLRPGEGEARPDVLSVDTTQEGGGSVQAGVLLPHEKLGVQNGIHLQRQKGGQVSVDVEKPHQRLKNVTSGSTEDSDGGRRIKFSRLTSFLVSALWSRSE